MTMDPPPGASSSEKTTPRSTAGSSIEQTAPRPSTSAPATILPATAHHHHQHLTNGQARSGESLPNLGDIDARCGGCHKVIDQDSGGVVVAFGSNLWHVDCFRCAKCTDRVSADTNLLLLSDGSPVCGNCSYQCFVCKQAITEEAIMTGDESYHAHCFTCRTCKRRIEELVFAKTSQGIYCMACHNERVARSRRHAEAKRQRAARKEREKDDTQRRDREEELRNHTSSSPKPPSAMLLGSPAAPPPASVLSPHMSPSATPNSVSSGQFPDNPIIPEDGTRSRELSVDRPVARAASPIGRIAEQMPLPLSPSDASHTTSRSSGPALNGSPQAKRPNVNGTPSLGPLPALGESNSSPSFGQSPSRNLNPGLGVGPVAMGLGPGLGVPMSKAERRRSINPAMTFNIDPQNSTYSAVDARNSPLPPSPLRTSFTDLQAEQQQPPRSPTSPSPAHIGADGFPFKSPALGSTPKITSNEGPPPRTSSLQEHLSSHDQPQSHATPSLPPRLPSGLSENEDNNPLLKTPQLSAPSIRPMSFSLSDPDFALILNHIDQSPKALDDRSPIAPTSIPAVKTEVQEASASDSSTSSPVAGLSGSSSSPALARSPQMEMLSSAVDGEASRIQAGQSQTMHPSGSVSPSRTRLSPSSANGPGSTPQLLRTRQPSAESTTSVSSRLGVDSSFVNVIEIVAAAKNNGQDSVQIDLGVLTGVISEMEDLKDTLVGLKNKYTGAKRTSQQYSEGLTVAGEEYDKELAHRRELEAEVIRLRAQVHSQTARLSVISGDERRQENLRRRSQDLANSLTGLERDISRLRAQRDMSLAEVEELNNTRGSDATSEEAAAALSQSLTNRLDTIKEQYREELEPLTAQREALQREINELRETREQFLEESTALAAKNEELAELNAQLSRQAEVLQDTLARARAPTIFNKGGRSHPSGSPSLSSLATSATLQEVPEETARVVKVSKPEPIEAAPARRFKWYKSSKGPDTISAPTTISRPLALPQDRRGNLQRPATEFGIKEHSFHQHSTMRFARCDLCQEKMWGLQELRCSSCGVLCHAKCAEKLPRSCTGSRNGQGEALDENAVSMFGRDLAEQVAQDNATVPVVVSKCIAAVEVVGMEYEGIYRKTGGSSQSKQITQLFERGDYDSFDLADVESFNDISSVTSVLKTYFRQLPNPLLTHALHESFVAAAHIRDPNNKHSALCALLKELPRENYNTLRALMLHLNRVTSLSSVNLMTSQNLGVVFGPTLMRSSDPNREFGDMAGKALTVQWMVEHAPKVFTEVQGEPSSQKLGE